MIADIIFYVGLIAVFCFAFCLIEKDEEKEPEDKEKEFDEGFAQYREDYKHEESIND
jgi:hypothetical protein